MPSQQHHALRWQGSLGAGTGTPSRLGRTYGLGFPRHEHHVVHVVHDGALRLGCLVPHVLKARGSGGRGHQFMPCTWRENPRPYVRPGREGVPVPAPNEPCHKDASECCGHGYSNEALGIGREGSQFPCPFPGCPRRSSPPLPFSRRLKPAAGPQPHPPQTHSRAWSSHSDLNQGPVA